MGLVAAGPQQLLFSVSLLGDIIHDFVTQKSFPRESVGSITSRCSGSERAAEIEPSESVNFRTH